jgi:hypothetical protein
MHRAIRAAAVGIVAAALAFGCTNPDDGVVEPIDAPVPDEDSGDNVEVEPEPDAAEDTDPEPESDVDPEPEIDISVIPDEITVEYVDAVLVELERLYAEAAQIAASDDQLSTAVTDRLNSVFSRELAERRRIEFGELLNSETGFRTAGELEPSWFDVSEVLQATSTCVWTVGSQDLSRVFAAGPGPRTTFALLGPKTEGLVVDMNPTQWAYRQVGVGDETDLRQERPC